MDGRFISSYSAYDYALGVKSCVWSPSNQFLAIGSYDQQVIHNFIVFVLVTALTKATVSHRDFFLTFLLFFNNRGIFSDVIQEEDRNNLISVSSQETFTCSKSIIESLEKVVK